jgi:hypothetical protein
LEACLLVEKLVNDLVVVHVRKGEFVHLHHVEPGVGKYELFACAVDLVDVLGNFDHLDAFHEIKLPNPNLPRVIARQNKVGIPNIGNTSDNRSMPLQLFFKRDRKSLILNLKHLHRIMITRRHYHLARRVIVKRVTARAAHVVTGDRLRVLVDDERLSVVKSCVTDTNATQVVYFADVVHHRCLLVDYLFAH